MAINEFHTLFDARERKVQTEKIYQGETVDLVAKITNDGVDADLTGYSVTGYYQPTEYQGTDQASVFYSVNAEISNGKVIVHWTTDNDFGKGPYQIWALLNKTGDQSYPVCWRLNLAHSPGYPAGETPEPIPQVLDFSQYELLNAPWLPLTGGTVTGNVTVNGVLDSTDIKVTKDGVAQVFIGNGAGETTGNTNHGGVAIGWNAKTAGNASVAIGMGAECKGEVAIGVRANAGGAGGIAIGESALTNKREGAEGSNSICIGNNAFARSTDSIAIGTYARVMENCSSAIQIGGFSGFSCNNSVPNSVQIYNQQVFQPVGTPSYDPAQWNLVLVKERAPWAVRKDEFIQFLATDWSGNPDMSKINLVDIAVAVNKCVAAITGKSIPTGTLPSDTTVTHFILTDGTEVTSDLTEFDEWTVNDVVMNSPYDRPNGDGRVESIVLGSGVTTLGHHAFAAFANLLSIDMSRATAITNIPARCFYQSPKLNTVVLPPNVATLSDACFGLCPALRKMTIPASVTGIDTWAFNGDTPVLTFTGRPKATIQAMANYSWHLGTGATLVGTDGTITI